MAVDFGLGRRGQGGARAVEIGIEPVDQSPRWARSGDGSAGRREPPRDASGPSDQQHPDGHGGNQPEQPDRAG